ncbi:MAG: helix-turn-helix transcriptional regulator [Desulfovibrio piger]|jgi:DNA-binding CsgD family transcriptional regulator|uniref:helix-turn-helix transcriptional regulator n=1 Tax=Desulfovibrio piger TaxID=901 RepID=UPI00399A8812
MLSISYGTVRWHLVNLRSAFAVRTTRELLIKIEASSITTVTPPSRIKLSPRGKQVLELFMHSFTYQQIAMQLGMSVSGVRRHCEKMLWKNGCESMLCLIAKYKRHRFHESCKHEVQSER